MVFRDERLFFESKGYSLKNWDDCERPIVLLGSVFDANSLGKWIYDWTVYCYDASAPMADLAGDLWLHLIKLAGKMKRAEECLSRLRIRSVESQETVEDFIQSGNRLWQEFKKILAVCEGYMWRRVGVGRQKHVLGKSAGIEFVYSIFGRDRELENIEKLMGQIRLWSKRFDVNCEPILGIDGKKYHEEEEPEPLRSRRRKKVVCRACGSTLELVQK